MAIDTATGIDASYRLRRRRGRRIPGRRAARDLRRASEIDMGQGETLVLVQQHLGNDWVRAVAMSTTDGLPRGAEAKWSVARSRSPSANPRSAGSST
ncbi:MAG: hypothetical protein R2849_12090 [Thermomicrobiales bacterium]